MNDHQREAGILLHPTSLPGPYGIGELGPQALKFVDFLAAAGAKLWQILPLGPTGYGDSPYASFSTFAGNPLLISLELLVKQGFLKKSDLTNAPAFDPKSVDYGWVQSWKFPLLAKAAQTFLASDDEALRTRYREFCSKEGAWLEDFALFMAVKEEYQKKADAEGLMGKMWSNFWDRDIRLKHDEAVSRWKAKLASEIEIKKVLQFWFFDQWLAVKAYANSKGIRIVGDIPIFVAPDSVDVWAHREFFELDSEGSPTAVAGVPPDYFSATGQLWGNPLYNWKALQADGFRWWIERIEKTLRLVDFVRIDHFRGFEAYWEIPAGAETAIAGRWVKAPGMELFAQIREKLGVLPILAEDLGLITPEVEQMRDAFSFPGMKILQFAFDSSEAGASGNNPFLPHNFGKNCVVYTGSHDNDTACGWFEKASKADQAYSLGYVSGDRKEVAWGFVRAAIASTARFAVIPAQDLLNLPTWARMNTPSTLGGNWSWRLEDGQLTKALAKRFFDLNRLYGRS